jgi:hypothetical protein
MLKLIKGRANVLRVRKVYLTPLNDECIYRPDVGPKPSMAHIYGASISLSGRRKLSGGAMMNNKCSSFQCQTLRFAGSTSVDLIRRTWATHQSGRVHRLWKWAFSDVGPKAQSTAEMIV